MIKEIDFIPETLKSIPNWVLWRKEERKGKLTKVPYSAYGFLNKASSTNPNTWATYEKCVDTYKKDKDIYSGIGFMITLSSGLIFIDIDHCFDNDGNLMPTAADIVGSLQDAAYIEISQSGSGLHALVFGDIERSFKNSKCGIEMYNQKRYCAITGRCIAMNEPTESQFVIDNLFDKYKTDKGTIDTRSGSVAAESLNYSDNRIIEKASSTPKTGTMFVSLYAGSYESYYNSQSEADLCLCQLLAFWTDRNEIIIDRIFRSSGLYRKKWERASYRHETIRRACNTCAESVSEYAQRKNIEEVMNGYAADFLNE